MFQKEKQGFPMKGFTVWQTVFTKEKEDVTVLTESGCVRLKLNLNSVSSQDVGCRLSLSLRPEGAGCGRLRVGRDD